MDVKRLGLALLVCGLAGCGSTPPVAPDVRAAGLRWDPGVAEKDQQWILKAIDEARPEARQLIDDVDGMVTIGTYVEHGGGAVGMMQPIAEGQYRVTFNLAYLDGERKIDRTATVLHELGHVVDHAVVPAELRDELAAQLPNTGACFTADTGDCTAPEERFADTFAKWALRGAVSAVGAGYGVATPASLEDWGMPLATLAIKIDIAAKRA